MDWLGARNGRTLAGLYLAAFLLALTGGFTANATNYQRAWQRLALGRELAAAWRALTR